MQQRLLFFLFLGYIITPPVVNAQEKNRNLIPVDSGWARNSINTVAFRKSSLTSFRDTQYIAFYNADGVVVVGKRLLTTTKWDLQKTPYKGNVVEAHNAISIAVDGKGYLHMAWDHHNNGLHYCQSLYPGSLALSEILSMTGLSETAVSYPEFYNLPNGNLIFLYREGSSGSGNVVINSYDVLTKKWKQLHQNLIYGEGKRNAYWQACADAKGRIYISWVWRENPDVASNHDLCYACSDDGGVSWKKSTGEVYQLPVTASSAEYCLHLPQGSDLINQTSMTTDGAGHPFIATYWRDSGATIPQYHIVYRTGAEWKAQNLGFRTTPFSLRGGGTKRIPVARPQVIAWQKGGQQHVAVFFRDEERNNKISVAVCPDLSSKNWIVSDLTDEGFGSWEPTYDSNLWLHQRLINLFVQRTEQSDTEGISKMAPQMIYVLPCRPVK